MTARATAAILVVALGATTAFAVTDGWADPPIGTPLTVYVTQTEVRTVSRRVDGYGVWWWRDRAIANRRLANRHRITLRRIQRTMRYRWAPTVDYAIDLASRVFGVSEWKMRSVAYCESTLNPF